MANNFKHCLEIILHHEGGYVNHPKDPGGMTNLGVTKRVYEAWVGKEVDESDIGHDGWEELEPRYAPQPGTRMAYAALKENSFAANLFVNGQTFETPLSIAKAICNAQVSQAMASDPQYLQLMQELVERGWFYAR